VAGVLVGMAVGLLVAGRDFLWGSGEDEPARVAQPVPRPLARTTRETAGDLPATAPDLNVIDDDGRTMWASPTSGSPLGLHWLPQGVQMMLALRPSALIAHPEGEKVLAALGPLGTTGVRAIEQTCGTSFGEIERLLIGWQMLGDGRLDATFVVYGQESVDRRLGELGHPRGARWQDGAWAFHRPQPADGPTLVAAASGVMDEIIEGRGEPPVLRRDMAKLLAQSDAERHVTLLVAPGVLFGEGGEIFAGQLAALRGPLDWLLGEGLTAASVSLHWDDNFFVETTATPTLDVPAGRVAEALLARVAELPDRSESYVLGLATSPHGRRVVSRLPAMTRKLVTYTRGGFDRDYIMLRAYLPAIAGHNLVMSAELALAEATGSTSRVAEAPSQTTNLTIEEKLQRVISLRMPRDTLEAALANLGQAIGVEIVIQGADLQADGITKNQSLTLDLQDRPAAEILVEILRRANPDKSAAGPADPRQKLVYVIVPKLPGGSEGITITTRGRAAERGETLPDVFSR
jgi:hypothetical protein